MLPTCSVLTKSVTVSVAVWKMGVVLRQAWSESQWSVLMRYLTISTNVRRYQTHHRWQLFISGRQCTSVLCVTQSNWVKMWFWCSPILPRSAEAQVIWGGIIKRLLIAYFIGNISAKKYGNPFMCVKVIASQRWDVFLRHGVNSLWLSYLPVYTVKHTECHLRLLTTEYGLALRVNDDLACQWEWPL